MEKDYLIIDRSKWRTGNNGYYATGKGATGKGTTKLLNDEGFMCCLGFRCEQMGISKENIFDKFSPSCIQNYNIPDLVNNKSQDTKFCNEAMAINDDCEISREEREEKIIKHFAKKNIIVEFKGKYTEFHSK